MAGATAQLFQKLPLTRARGLNLDIDGWLRGIGLEQYAQTFRDNAIDADVLCDLTDEHLRELGLPLGARLKLLRAVAALNTGQTPVSQETTTPAPRMYRFAWASDNSRQCNLPVDRCSQRAQGPSWPVSRRPQSSKRPTFMASRARSSRQDRPTLLPFDRLFWMLACRFWSEWKKSLFVVTPETVVRWHRAGFRLLCLATILSGFEMNSIGKRSKIRSAITLAPCSSSFGSGLESFFASFAPAEA